MAEDNSQSISKSLKGILARLDGLEPALNSISSSTSETADAVTKPPKPNNEETFERRKLNERIVESIKNMTKEFSDRISVLQGAFKDLQGGGIFSKLGTIIQIGFAVGAAYFYRAYKAIEPIINIAKAVFTKIGAIFDKLKLAEKFQKAIGFIAKIKDAKPVKFVLDILQKVGKFFQPVINFLKKFTGPGGKVLGFLKNIMGVFKPVLSIFKPVIGIVSKLGKFLKAVPLLGQIITIIEGVYGAFKGFFSTEGSLVDKIFGAISGAVAQILQGLTFGLLDFDTTFEFLTGFFTTVREFFATYIPPIWESLKESFTIVFTTISEWFMSFLAGAWEATKVVIDLVWGAIKLYFEYVLMPMWEGVKFILSAFWEGLKLFFEYVLMPVWEGVKYVMLAFWEGLKIAWEYISPIVTGVLDGISWAFGKMYEFFVETVPGLFTKILMGAVSMAKGVMGVINSALDYIPGLGPNTIDTAFLDKLELGLKVVGPSALLGGAPKKSSSGSEVVTQTQTLNEGRSRMALGGTPSTNLAVAPVTNVQNNTFTKQPIRSSPSYDYDLGPKF